VNIKLLRNGSIYLLGDVISKIVPFVLLPYFSRVLSADEFGRLSLYQAYYNLIIIFLLYGVDATLLRTFHRYGKFAASRVFVLSIICISVIFIVLLIVSINLNGDFFISTVTAYFLALNAVILVYFQSVGNVSSYVKFQIGNVLVSSLMTVLLFYFVDASVGYRAVAICLSAFFFCFFSLFQLKSHIVFSNVFTNFPLDVKYILSFGFGVTINKLSFFVRGQLDRIVISNRYVLSELAVFSLASQISLAFSILLIATNKVYAPYIYRRIKNNNITKKNVLFQIAYSATFPLIVYLIMILVPSEFYIYVFGDDYSDVALYVPQMSLGQSIQIVYMIMSTIIIYFGRIKMLSIITISCSVLHFVLLNTLSLIGIYEVSWLSFFSGVIQIIIIYVFLFRKLRFSVAL